MNSFIDNYFENENVKLEVRIHSLEIQLDILFDLLIDKINKSDKILLRDIVRDNKLVEKYYEMFFVGDVLDCNIYHKIKSASIVEYGHPDYNTLEFIERNSRHAKPYYNSFPTIVAPLLTFTDVLNFEEECYCCSIYQNGILYSNTYHRAKKYIFRIYFSQTNIVEFNLPYEMNNIVLHKFAVDENNLYFYAGQQIQYVCDLNGKPIYIKCLANSENDVYQVKTRNMEETTTFNNTILLVDVVFKYIDEVYTTDLYILIRCQYKIFFFIKKSLLYSHYIENKFGFSTYTFLHDSGDYLVNMDTRFCQCSVQVLFLNGKFRCFNFDSNHSIFKNNMELDKYYVCLIEKNIIWCAPRTTWRGVVCRTLIKLEF